MNIDDSESAIASQKKPAIIPLFELIKIGGKNGYEEIALLYTRAGPPPLSNIHDRPRRLSLRFFLVIFFLFILWLHLSFLGYSIRAIHFNGGPYE